MAFCRTPISPCSALLTVASRRRSWRAGWSRPACGSQSTAVTTWWNTWRPTQAEAQSKHGEKQGVKQVGEVGSGQVLHAVLQVIPNQDPKHLLHQLLPLRLKQNRAPSRPVPSRPLLLHRRVTYDRRQAASQQHFSKHPKGPRRRPRPVASPTGASVEAESYVEAAKAMLALWPTGRPSPKLTDSENIELRAIWRNCSLVEWRAAIRRLADEGRRLRPHVGELRAAVKLEIDKRTDRLRDRELRRLPDRQGAAEAPGRVAQLRRKLADSRPEAS
ncbi:MAG: hypothetical protein KGL39_29960 [Patescibacteria group bacterium]|nr:hypothetical protein [Patescibacteria group bacterium]